MSLTAEILKESFKHVLLEKKGVSYKYSSTQFNLPSDIAKEVKKLSKAIPDDQIYTDPEDPSYGREDDIHVTILYGIHSDSVDEIKEALKDIEPFSAKLSDISFFDADNYKVLKVDVVSKGIKKLHKHLRNHLENSFKWPEYNPHMTIAYVTKDYKIPDKSVLKDKVFMVDSVTISTKSGEKKTIKLKDSK